MADSALTGSSAMGNHKSHSLFQVYLRLRPTSTGAGSSTSSERFINVEPPAADAPSTAPTHILLNPPNDRRRAIEKFAFTQVLEEDATQLDVFECTNIVSLVEGVLAPHGGEGTDALLATLGVTGSGKSHTILGSRTQRGLTQLSLDAIFRSIGDNIATPETNSTLEASVKSSDASEAHISSAAAFIEAVYGDISAQSRPSSQVQTPQIVRARQFPSFLNIACSLSDLKLQGLGDDEPPPRPSASRSIRIVHKEDYTAYSPCTPEREPLACTHGIARFSRPPLQAKMGNAVNTPSLCAPSSKHYMSVTASTRQRKRSTKTLFPKNEQTSAAPPTPRRHLNRPSTLPQAPDISNINVACDPAAEYSVLVSMYEVYNDRIFDLLMPAQRSAATKEFRRRPLLFKSTELSPDRKVVAGLRKILCSNLNQALLVLEAGLQERRVAGTGSNSVSSRSHGFFSIEVKKRKRSNSKRHQHVWGGSTLTIVDLAGSERARDAKTAGATLAEAGKINESLMYLGQCLQMQSGNSSTKTTNVVPFRQCKLTELLFSNSFLSASSASQSQSRRHPQRGVMIVTADASGDYNATSQILRYSAVAREITVPRIPSITEMIHQANTAPLQASVISSSCSSQSPVMSPGYFHQRPPFLPPGTTPQSPNGHRNFTPISSLSEDRVTMEHAALEIARLSDENRHLKESLAREQTAREAAEAHLLSLEDKMVELEQVVREDCVAEFEQRLAVELSRWKTGMQMAIERGEEHWDRKMEVFERSLALQNMMTGSTEDYDKENVLVESLEDENSRLRREVKVLQRELAGRTPSKRAPLMEREEFATSGQGSPMSARSLKGGRHNNEENIQGELLHRRIEDLTLQADYDGRSSSAKKSGSANSSRATSRSPANSAQRRVRKLTPRKWEGGGLGDEEYDPFFCA